MLGARLFDLPPVRTIACLSVLIGACSPHSAGKQEARRGDCATCHADEALQTSEPPHVEAQFGQDCSACHDEERWLPSRGFVHTQAFSLSLSHDGPACADCHTETYAPGVVPNQCVDCHRERAEAVVNPVHAGLSQSCSACHGTDQFLPSSFIHSWPLEGAHAEATCASCHPGTPAQYEGTATACASCHLDDRARADMTVENHATFPSTCETCHKPQTF